MAANEQDNSATRRRAWVILFLIAVAVVLLAAFMSMNRKDVPVRVERAMRGDIISAIATNGKVEPVDSFEAHAPAPTTVRRIAVHEGDHVKPGQLLLQLDDAEARAQAAKAQAQLRAAEADLHAVHTGGTREEVLTTQSQITKAQTEVDGAQRNLEALRRLQQKGAASAAEVQSAEVRLQTAEADLKLAQGRQSGRFSQQDVERVEAQAAEARASLTAAQELLTHSEIRAPREGRVYSLPVHAGQFVNTGDLLVQVADLHTVQVRAFVDEPDIGRLRSEQPVQITWDAVPGRTWQGTLTRVPSTVVTVGSRQVGEITCRVDNADLTLLPNVNVGVNIITAHETNAMTVSREAVHQEGGQRFVYHVENGVLRRHNVDTGVSNLTQIQITKGLEDNAEVALGATNGKALRDAMPVRIVTQ